MTSIRHKKDAMLDAARDCVLAVGVRRTTLTDVARRAGVSRMTIYRRWPDVRTLVADLMTREWASVVARVTPPGEGAPVRPQAVEALVAGVAALRGHPLFHKILEVDPEVLLPYLLQRRGTTQDAMLRAFEKTLRAGHRDGTIRAGDPARQARAVLLIVQSFAMSGHIVADGAPALSPQAFDDELRQILDRYLAP
ncbi:TetR/AcrR family transcriptional regulator [Actinoallomurus rhizosphaericola]|uniref:TetR/AcrR family transcriptional regulator n=1 Tax=Actinoallomurus rhizosphaericola TaxID=2952536 RepID=UPI002091465F|nr:TetR/AcrR family transcriptional regulator [Actinoallomurus rhizosphaericola]MCO5993428.1 TetR/AcrR family transcriptional regulator [Actinoallomurus rhizosphaericola]